LVSSSGLIVSSAIWFWAVFFACNTAPYRLLPIGGRLSLWANFWMLDLLLFMLILLSWFFGDEIYRFSLLGVALIDFLTISSYWEFEDYNIFSFGFLNGGESSEIIESANGLAPWTKLLECLFGLAMTPDGWMDYFREDMCLIFPMLSS
jgi:Zn-dependent protease with chaperone function